MEATQRAYSWIAPEDVERARRVVAAFEEAESEGLASMRIEGQFVDHPIYRRAVEKLRLHDEHERRRMRRCWARRPWN